jgi:hypothetical protein
VFLLAHWQFLSKLDVYCNYYRRKYGGTEAFLLATSNSSVADRLFLVRSYEKQESKWSSALKAEVRKNNAVPAL